MRRVIFCSGAGVSAAAGIPTFRDANGLWHSHKIEDVCSMSSWPANFELVHEFYNQRRKDVWDKQCTMFHSLVAELQRDFSSDQVINITTNVDDLFEKAGCLSTLHLHGELNKVSLDYGRVRDGLEDPLVLAKPEFNYKQYPNSKPSVVFFGESAPAYGDLWRIAANTTPDDWIIIAGSSEQVIGFADEFFNAKNVWFVNPDTGLYKTRYGIKKFEMTSEEFARLHSQGVREFLNGQ